MFAIAEYIYDQLKKKDICKQKPNIYIAFRKQFTSF